MRALFAPGALVVGWSGEPDRGNQHFMMNNPSDHMVLSKNSAGVRAATRQEVDARTRELAQIAGRALFQVSQADYEQAKREVTGVSDSDRQQEILDALPETKVWDPVPGSARRHALESPDEDEDAEGRSETEPQVDDGAMAAGRDRARQAAHLDDEASNREPRNSRLSDATITPTSISSAATTRAIG